jgi:hypothetical protein
LFAALGPFLDNPTACPRRALRSIQCMAKKPAPLKATPINDTAVITACAAAIKGAPEVYAEELAERIYRAMTSVRAAK